MRTSWRIGKIFGVEINIDSSWLIIFGLVSWTLAGSYFPQQYPGWNLWLYWVTGVATALVFFASVLGHELAHSLMAIQQGEKVRSITLFLFGGVAQIAEEPDRPFKEFLMAFVGPLFSLGISILFAILWVMVRTVNEPLAALTRYLAMINVILALFNLIPGFPLDGGRILRAIIWGITGNLKKATRWASSVGQGIAFLFILWGIWQMFNGLLLSGLWMIFIGWFLQSAAVRGYHQLVMRDMLRNVRAEDLMMRDFETVSGSLSLQQLVDDYIFRHRDRAFLVAGKGRLQGIICLEDVKAVPRNRWASTRVDEVATPRERLEAVSPDDDGNAVLSRLSVKNVHQVPVIVGDQVIGIVCRSDVIRFLQLRGELGV